MSKTIHIDTLLHTYEDKLEAYAKEKGFQFENMDSMRSFAVLAATYGMAMHIKAGAIAAQEVKGLDDQQTSEIKAKLVKKSVETIENAFIEIRHA